MSNERALNGICPYYTMFPLEFPLKHLDGITKGSWVFDPFCGRGTTAFAARLLGLPSAGTDVNPVAVAIARAKLVQVKPESIVRLAKKILSTVGPDPTPTGRFWELAYAPKTLDSILRLRAGLRLAKGPASDALRGIVLGSLHGPQPKTKDSYFSNQMQRTFAPKPDYAVHRIFAFTHNGARYLVPSLVLMRAFFRPLPRISRTLFSPQGLAQTAIFQMEGSKPVIQELSCLQVNHKYNATLQALSWYWCFPSAHKCWHSVYAHAAKGNLAIDLPMGSMNCIVHGVQSDSVFRVVSLTVRNVETSEQPFEYAASHPQTINFRDRVGKSTRHGSHDPLIRRRGSEWALSDTEWEAVRLQIVPNKPHPNQHYDLRKIVDFVIEKVGSGKTWRGSGKASISWNLAQRHYRKWCVDGRWERIRGTLIQLRGS